MAGRIDEIKARLAAATPGPWHSYASHVYGAGKDGANICSGSELRSSTTVGYYPARVGSPDLGETYANVAFIAAAPADIAYLVRRVEATAGRPTSRLDLVACVARSIVEFVQDADRCIYIGTPKEPPCETKCDCWERAMLAAEMATGMVLAADVEGE